MNKKPKLLFDGIPVTPKEHHILKQIQTRRMTGLELASLLGTSEDSVWFSMSALHKKFPGRITRGYGYMYEGGPRHKEK